jgi:hypothetical protein
VDEQTIVWRLLAGFFEGSLAGLTMIPSAA